MTMRELMTHTAGLGYVLNSSNPVDRMIIQGRVLDTAAPLQTMIDKLGKLPLVAQPGTRWSYSIAVDVQGYLVEKFSGMKFDEFLRTRLFEPLGMKDTAFYVPQEKLSRLALVHTDSKAGGLEVDENRPDPKVVPLGPSGGGGLFSTAMDYARFTEMMLNGGQLNGVRILAPRTVEMMRTNYVNPEPLKTMGAGDRLEPGLPGGDRCRRRGRAVLERRLQLVRHRGHLVLDRSGRGLRVHRHAAEPEPRHRAPDPRAVAEPRLSGDHGLMLEFKISDFRFKIGETRVGSSPPILNLEIFNLKFQ